MIRSFSQIKRLSKKYDIPAEDILLIALNCCGVKAEIPEKRIRFKLKLNTCDEIFYFAVCVNTGESPFFIKDDRLFFYKNPIGYIIDQENDTCDSTYFRRNRTALTLNSNSRSKCRGCKFCGTYNQDAEDINNLLTEDRLVNHINEILIQNSIADLSSFVYIAICTGCLKNEENTLEHILMVRRVLNKQFKFTNELVYIGSQITSAENLKTLKKLAEPFSLYLTMESFTRRKDLLRHSKAQITISKAKRILKSAMNKGIDTTILYILGLDPIDILVKEFREFSPYLTKFPIINLFQNYLSDHELLKIPEAKNIEYFLIVRKKLEKIFANSALRPKPWENYRSLWYLTFNNEKINDIRT